MRPKNDADRRDAGDQIADATADLSLRRRQNSQMAIATPMHAAVKRHAAFPDRDELDGIGEESIGRPPQKSRIRRDAAEDGAVEQHPSRAGRR